MRVVTWSLKKPRISSSIVISSSANYSKYFIISYRQIENDWLFSTKQKKSILLPMQVFSFRNMPPQQWYLWRTSVSTIMKREAGSQRHNIRIMTVLSPYHTRGGVLICCQIESQSRGMCHDCQRTRDTRGGGGWGGVSGQTQTEKSFGFLITKSNQSMFKTTWEKAVGLWMFLLLKAGVGWGPCEVGVQCHSPSWPPLLLSLCPVA